MRKQRLGGISRAGNERLRRLLVTHPLAATLLRRAMIEDTLNGAKSPVSRTGRISDQVRS